MRFHESKLMGHETRHIMTTGASAGSLVLITLLNSNDLEGLIELEI